MKISGRAISFLRTALSKATSFGLTSYPNSSIKFRLVFGFFDFLIQLFVRIPSAKSPVARPNSVLIVNGAHLGDVLLSTAILPLIRKTYPDVKIGFIVGSWSADALRNNVLVDEIYIVDHFRLNRSRKSIAEKILAYIKTSHKALKEIRKSQYEVAINLYAKPNIIPLLWLARIPTRVGYIHGGFGPLLTHRLVWKNSNNHITTYHADLLFAISADVRRGENYRYVIPEPTQDELATVDDFLSANPHFSINYIIFHIGTGEPKREWPHERWRDLAVRLREHGQFIVFTGHGQRESELILQITEGLDGYVNLCGLLNWRQFISVVSRAAIVYCVESVASHVASGLRIRCVAIWSGLNNPNYFKPMGQSTITVTADVPCIGCQHGCKDMLCVRNVSVDEIVAIPVADLGKGIMQ